MGKRQGTARWLSTRTFYNPILNQKRAQDNGRYWAGGVIFDKSISLVDIYAQLLYNAPRQAAVYRIEQGSPSIFLRRDRTMIG